MNEIRYHLRLNPNISMAQMVRSASGMTDDQLADYIFVVRFDDERIRLPKIDGKSDTDKQDIHKLIEAKWSGTAMDLSELNAMMAPFEVYVGIPIVIELYPKDEVASATSGKKVVPEFVDYDDPEHQAKVSIRDALASIMEMVTAFRTDWGTGQRRDEHGKFAGYVREDYAPPLKDKVIDIDGNEIRIAPNGQVRLPSGKLGAKPVNKFGGKELDVNDSPFRVRKDGSVWMRAKARRGSKLKVRWIKVG